jgi:transposase
MSDKEWACLEAFAISRGAGSGRRPKNHRRVLDGIFWIARTGVAWRDLLEYFGNWSSVYRQFRRWTLSGLWELLLDAFNDSSGGNPGLQMIDSTIIRAHHCSAGSKPRRICYDPDEEPSFPSMAQYMRCATSSRAALTNSKTPAASQRDMTRQPAATAASSTSSQFDCG